MSIRWPMVFIALVLGSAAQAAEPIFPLGSRLGLTPPAGMVPSRAFRGFEDPTKKAVILLAELPAQAYPDLEKGFSVETLKSQGIEVEHREEAALKEGHGFIFVARQQTTETMVRKWALVAIAGNVTALVTLQVPETAKDAYPDAVCRAALESLIVRASIPIEEQLSLLPFKLRDLAGFRIARTLPDGTTLLADGPKDELASIDQPFLVIGIPPQTPPQPADRASFAYRLFLGTRGIKDIRIVRSEPQRISGQQGHELMAEAKDATSGANLTLIQWLRFGSGGYLYILGLAPSDTWAGAFARMRAVRDGIEPK